MLFAARAAAGRVIERLRRWSGPCFATSDNPAYPPRPVAETDPVVGARDVGRRGGGAPTRGASIDESSFPPRPGCRVRRGLSHLGVDLPRHSLGRGRDSAVPDGRRALRRRRARVHRLGRIPGGGASDRPRLDDDRPRRAADGGRRERAGHLGAATRAVRPRRPPRLHGAVLGGARRLVAARRRPPSRPRDSGAGAGVRGGRAARQPGRGGGGARPRPDRRRHHRRGQPVVGRRF